MQMMPLRPILFVWCLTAAHLAEGQSAIATQAQANGSRASEVSVTDTDQEALAVQDVVEKYLKLGFNGAWLTYDGRIQIGRLTAWTPNEQNLMSIQVISSYRVTGASRVGNTGQVFVELDLVGWLVEEFYKFEVDRQKVRVVFRARKDDGNWRIVEPDSPMIHWYQIVKYLEQIAPNMANPAYFRKLAKDISDRAK